MSKLTSEYIRLRKEILCTHQLEKEDMLGSYSFLNEYDACKGWVGQDATL